MAGWRGGVSMVCLWYQCGVVVVWLSGAGAALAWVGASISASGYDVLVGHLLAARWACKCPSRLEGAVSCCCWRRWC